MEISKSPPGYTLGIWLVDVPWRAGILRNVGGVGGDLKVFP